MTSERKLDIAWAARSGLKGRVALASYFNRKGYDKAQTQSMVVSVEKMRSKESAPLKRKVSSSMVDEKRASPDYLRLAHRLNKAGHPEASEIVKKIAKDERKHRKILTRIGKQIK